MNKVVVAVMALLFATAACGSTEPAVAVQAPAPGLSDDEAAEIVSAYYRANNEVNAAMDVAGVRHIEAAPLLTASEAGLRIIRRLGRNVPVITADDNRYVVPSDARWFVATATRAVGGVPRQQATWTVFTEQGESWFAAYSLTPMDDVPKPAVNAAGAASIVRDFTGLLVDPTSLGRIILDHYAKDLAGKDLFAKSVALDEQLSNGFRTSQTTLRGKENSLVRLLDPAVHPIYALRAEDGGALVFTASTVVDLISATSPSAAVTFGATSNEGALRGQAITAREVTITRLQTFLVHVPPRAIGGEVTVLAFTENPIGVI